MKVRYTPQAFADRRAIYFYLRQRNPDAALRIDRLIAERTNRLGDNPHLGRATDRAGIHTIWIAPYPYRVFYRVTEDAIDILHIRHTARRAWKGAV